jgi:signal transduction histidine kinase
MNINWNITGPEGLAFFGAVIASSSHELRNALAIINENSGLLEDFVLMAEKGIDIDPEKLVTLSERIACQVQRADEIISNLNAFAHSVDHPSLEVDICYLLELTVALTSRTLAARKVQAILGDCELAMISTSPFHFINLVGRCLEFAARGADQEKKIFLSCIKRDQGATIIFSGLVPSELKACQDKNPEKIAEAFGAEIMIDAEHNCLRLTVPEGPPAHPSE